MAKKGPPKKAPDLLGKKFGMLTVVKLVDYKNREYRWECLCDCGKTTRKSITSTRLRYGKTTSCGCKRQRNAENHHLWKGTGIMPKRAWTSILRGAAYRNIKVTLTMVEAEALLQKQQLKCALSGVPLKMTTRWNEKSTASLDRIDSTKGYSKDNVQWVHKDLNKMKQEFPNQVFIEWCKAVTEHDRDINSKPTF